MDALALEIDLIVKKSLEEDVAGGDITSELTLEKNSTSSAKIIAKEAGIISGMLVIEHILKTYSSLSYAILKNDGESVENKECVLLLSGSTLDILKLERTLLNFLQQLSGVATLSNKYVNIVKPFGCKILDTRKTIPGLRYLQKKAVKDGGGTNHRIGLFDAILLKENHIKAVGSIKKAVSAVKASSNYNELIKNEAFFLEVETENFEEVKEACYAGADIIMLDNMDNELTTRCIAYINNNFPNIQTEISGGVNESTLKTKASLMPDRISLGEITHSAPILDLSLLLK